MKRYLRVVVDVLGGLIALFAAAVLAVLRWLWALTVAIYDIVLSRRTVEGGLLVCPRGHGFESEAEGLVFECGACKFVYEGSMFRCPNPECGATTPYVNCPTCGLSVRSPYRWGRP